MPTPHTGVHEIARRFLEPIQDALVLGTGLALFGLMVRTLVRRIGELFSATLDRHVLALTAFLLGLGALLRFGDLRTGFFERAPGARPRGDGASPEPRALRADAIARDSAWR